MNNNIMDLKGIMGYTEFIKAFVIDELKELENTTLYMCDLGFTLTEEINVNGSYTFSTYEAKRYIAAWFDEASMVFEYQKENYGTVKNPFENPEVYHVIMIIEGVNNLINGLETVSNLWDEKIELTKDLIDKIILEIAMAEEIEF